MSDTVVSVKSHLSGYNVTQKLQLFSTHFSIFWSIKQHCSTADKNCGLVTSLTNNRTSRTLEPTVVVSWKSAENHILDIAVFNKTIESLLKKQPTVGVAVLLRNKMGYQSLWIKVSQLMCHLFLWSSNIIRKHECTWHLQGSYC